MKPITRREMLTLGSAAAVALPIISTSADELSTTKPRLKVIVTGGHPGDPEYGVAGRSHFILTGS